MDILSLGIDLNLVIIIVVIIVLGQLCNLDQIFIINQIYESVLKENIWFFSGGRKIKVKIAIVLKILFNHYTKSYIADVKFGTQL